MLTDILRCRTGPCADQRRIYVAISAELCTLALAATEGSGAGRYIFKVGRTDYTCDHRRHTLNQALIPGRPRPRGYGRTKPYAGVQDWDFIGCWPVPNKKYEQLYFRPWLQHVPDVGAVDPYDFPWVPQVGGPAPTELFTASPSFLSADLENIKPHHVIKDMIRVMQAAFLSMIRDGKLPSVRVPS